MRIALIGCKNWPEVLKDKTGEADRKHADGEVGDCAACELIHAAEQLDWAAAAIRRMAEKIHEADRYRLNPDESIEFSTIASEIASSLGIVEIFARSEEADL